MDSQNTEVKTDVEEQGQVKQEVERSWELLERRRRTVMTGNVFLPKFGEDESETQRGTLAINNLIKELREGYKCVFLISHQVGVNALFMQTLGRELDHANVNKDSLRIHEKEIKGYGDARRFGLSEAVLSFPEAEVLFQGEAEKDLTPYLDDLIQPLFEGRAGIVTMRRESLKSLPFYQQMGEAIQDGLIHDMQRDAGISVGERAEDVLNGSRFILNKPLETRYGRAVNPLDLFTKLNFVYDGESAEMVKNLYTFGIDKYCSEVYFPLVVARELGIVVEEERVPYIHNSEQTALENKDEKFREKRISQAKDIVAQHFDLIASMLVYKAKGEWPQVLWKALDEGTNLEIRHFDMKEWEIEDGRLVKK